jgi:hypothetical protein
VDIPSAKLSQEELNALPENVKEYIRAVEAELETLRQRLRSNEAELNRKRHAYWSR